MSETRGVFGIFDIVNSKLDDQWVSLDDVWITVGISTTRFIDGAGPSPGAQPPAATPTPQTYNGSPVNV
jgi:hypothetical protein